MADWFDKSDWYPSKWGTNDELGALNEVTPEKILGAAKLVRIGKVYMLAHLIHNDMPVRAALHGPFSYFISQRVYDHRPPLREPTVNKFGAALGRLEMVDHAATHLDALSHISLDNKLYNGVDSFEATTPRGTLRMGVETTPPIITRGLMMDVPSLVGRQVLEKGHIVTVDETERFLKAKNLRVGRGDALFIYTGVSKLWMDTAMYNEYWESSPGIGYELAKWLDREGVALAGSDTPASEVVPPELKGTRLPVHQYLITKCGIRLIDNIKLDGLAQDGVYEFLFMCSPLPIKGATGSPVAPLAVV